MPNRERYIEDSSLDPAFHMPLVRSLSVIDREGVAGISDYFAHAIAREPVNLLVHVQRINYHRSKADQEALFGALADLFITLQGKADYLQRRMLESSKACLSGEGYAILNQCLGMQQLESNQQLHCKESVLAHGCRGAIRLIEKNGERQETEWDALLIAQDHLEYGQLEEARSVLLEAIEKNPQRLDLHKELIAIYRHTRDKVGCRQMLLKMEAISSSVCAAWSALHDQLERSG